MPPTRSEIEDRLFAILSGEPIGHLSDAHRDGCVRQLAWVLTGNDPGPEPLDPLTRVLTMLGWAWQVMPGSGRVKFVHPAFPGGTRSYQIEESVRYQRRRRRRKKV